MKRVALYSSSNRASSRAADRGLKGPASPEPPHAPDEPHSPGPWRRLMHGRRGLAGLALVGLMLALIATAAYHWREQPQAPTTQEQIDAAVRHSLNTINLPSPAAKAYEMVRPSVVRVVGSSEADDGGKVERQGVGSGVVIVDSGVILTSLHVVATAKRIAVTFADGMEAEAAIVSAWPEHDLAVIRAQAVPDDLPAATLRSTADLLPGDRVVAVGFPFGIGPSVSSGVVSGLRREYRSPDGSGLLSNLIQFDAAANPGSSGGPLITDDGEVVGIVTAILNPSDQRVFIGIGFAVPIENAAAAAGMSPF